MPYTFPLTPNLFDRSRPVFDTQIAAGFIGMGAPSLASLVERLLGVKLAKGDRLTDWTRRPLKAEQKIYAAADGRAALDILSMLEPPSTSW